MNLRQFILAVAVVVGGLIANACDGEVPCDVPSAKAFSAWQCRDIRDSCKDPDRPLLHDDACMNFRRKCEDPNDELYQHEECAAMLLPTLPPDAGTDTDASEDEDAGASEDAAFDAATDGQSARGTCIPNAPDYFADPQPVWIGPNVQDIGPTDCPTYIGAPGGQGYFALYVPPSDGCAKCACGPIEGTCSPQVTSIHVRSGLCSIPEAPTTPFDPPENWDGSCTNDHAIPANAECPAGSGIPCAQSIYVSALPDPVQGCKPVTIPVPKAITDAPRWQKVALSCSPQYFGTDGCEGSESRWADIPDDDHWRYCVHHTHKGVHACPEKGKYTNQYVVYPHKAIIDHRSCTECGCKASGGACYGTFNVYEDENCTKLLTTETLGSDAPDCDDLLPPGRAVGSKEIVNLKYESGSCEPTGGFPVGSVEIDETDAVTWCCIEPWDLRQ
ncbi:MAG: hypothetical protein IPM54_45630 [Polyangiaceae bacterium]|nr:hypothetical protein [Polyangiaceae bacterium]